MSGVDAKKELILDSGQINQKIRRIAVEIFENNFREKSVVLAGIDGQGYSFAKTLAAELEGVSPLKTQVVKVSLDKLAPQQGEVTIDADPKEIHRKCIILIDDVLNTGRTLTFGLKPFLRADVKKIEIAVLVNRSHTMFPIAPTYTGLELSTTLTDHVEVVLGKKSTVYLH